METALPPNLPLFHQPWWLDATGLPWAVATAQNGDAISGIWPFFLEKKYGISLLRNPPLCPYLGPWVAFPADLKESRKESFEHQTVASLLKQLPPAQVVSTALLPGLKQLDAFAEQGFKATVRQTFLLSLEGLSETELLQCLSPDYRRNVRKAAGELQITDSPEALADLYRFSAATLARKGLKPHFSFAYLQGLFNAAHARGQAALWTARKGDAIQAVVWHVWDAERSYYLMGAKNPAVQDARALTALLFHAMNHSRIGGKKNFDFEGSMDPGVAHFFRHFGGQKELYLILEKADSLLWRIKNRLL